MRNLDCEEFIKISKTFEVRPELIEDVTKMYELNKPSEIYTKMCELGFNFNYINFICLYNNEKKRYVEDKK